MYQLEYRVFQEYGEWVAIPVGDPRLQFISGVSENPVGALHECIIGVIGAMEILEEE